MSLLLSDMRFPIHFAAKFEKSTSFFLQPCYTDLAAPEPIFPCFTAISGSYHREVVAVHFLFFTGQFEFFVYSIALSINPPFFNGCLSRVASHAAKYASIRDSSSCAFIVFSLSSLRCPYYTVIPCSAPPGESSQCSQFGE